VVIVEASIFNGEEGFTHMLGNSFQRCRFRFHGPQLGELPAVAVEQPRGATRLIGAQAPDVRTAAPAAPCPANNTQKKSTQDGNGEPTGVALETFRLDPVPVHGA
jgi:hypothetical protein